MYDSITVADLPPASVMVAAYANGHYLNYPAARERFPEAVVVSISTTADVSGGLAHVLDIERGDATPDQYEEWARTQRAHGVVRPTAYCSASTARAYFSRPGRRRIADLWVADWTGLPHQLVVRGCRVVAVQYASPGHGSEGHYDVSAVYDDDWHPAGH
jgi:hypothetical protein